MECALVRTRMHTPATVAIEGVLGEDLPVRIKAPNSDITEPAAALRGLKKALIFGGACGCFRDGPAGTALSIVEHEFRRLIVYLDRRSPSDVHCSPFKRWPEHRLIVMAHFISWPGWTRTANEPSVAVRTKLDCDSLRPESAACTSSSELQPRISTARLLYGGKLAIDSCP